MSAMKFLPADDLAFVVKQTGPFWEGLRGKRIFITGGTGFFGRWLLESLLLAQQELGLGNEVTVLTRAPQAFVENAPHIARHPSIHLLAGDVRSFSFPDGEFPYIIHAATPASARLIQENPLEMFDIIVGGTQRVLEFARLHATHRLLFTSSGAIYGKQPANIAQLSELDPYGPDLGSPASAYAEGKRAAEMACTLYASSYGIQVRIARCFAFVGPGLPLDLHFAVGNFIRDGLRGGPILVKGDGTALRSYLYAADLAIWLWTILLSDRAEPVTNVGSDEAFSIAEVARSVAGQFEPQPKVEVLSAPLAGKPAERYIPDIARAQTTMGLRSHYTLLDAITRTICWHRA